MKDTIEMSAGRVLTHIDAEIKVREEELSQLNITRKSLVELFPPAEPQPAQEPVQTTRPPKAKPANGGERKSAKPVVAAAGASAAPLDDDTPTIGGTMKKLARELGNFTRAELKEKFLAVPGMVAMHAASPSAFAGNLGYWAKTGKLKQMGEGDTEHFEVNGL